LKQFKGPLDAQIALVATSKTEWEDAKKLAEEKKAASDADTSN
jgi:hypothetical protein